MSKDSPVISVVMPTYQRAAMMRRAIASVQEQSYANWELIVSDDEVPGAEAWELLQGLAAEDERIRIFQHHGSSGQIENNNHAMTQARGVWIKPLFDDDELKPDCLLRFMELAQRHPQVALLSCWADIQEGNRIRMVVARPNTPSVKILSGDEVRVGLLRQSLRLGTPLQMMFHRRVLDAGLSWRRVEGMSSAFDSDFFYRVLGFGDAALIRESLVVQHLGHATGTALMDAEPGKLDEDLRLLMRELHAACDPGLRPELKRCLHELELVRGLHRIGRYGRWKEGLRMILRPHPPSAWGHVIRLLLFNPEFRWYYEEVP